MMRSLTLSSLAICLFALGLQGCYTTRVIPGEDASFVRFSGPDSDERIVRRESWIKDQHHFVLGFVPHPSEWRISDVVRLRESESLVNTRVTTEMTPTNVLIQVGAAILTQGISPLLWQMTTVRVEGDVVVRQGEDSEEAEAPEEKSQTAPSSEQPEAPSNKELSVPQTPASPNWRVISGSRSHESATSACGKLGMRLPTRDELKAQRGTLAKGGEFWTSDSEKDFEEEYWFVDMASGATFLKSSESRLSVACVSGRAD